MVYDEDGNEIGCMGGFHDIEEPEEGPMFGFRGDKTKNRHVHPTHKMSAWEQTIISTPNSDRFGELRKCLNCEVEQSSTVTGTRSHKELRNPCNNPKKVITKYVVTLVRKTNGTTWATVTRRPEKVEEIRSQLDKDEIMFVNKYEYEE